MKHRLRIAVRTLAALALLAPPALVLAQDDGGAEIIVTAQRRNEALQIVGGSSTVTQLAYLDRPPQVGLRRQADGAVRLIAIQSDSRDAAMRRREVQAMLLAALDMAKREGLSLVTGQYEIREVTRDNWRDLFPGLATRADSADAGTADEDDEDDEDEDSNGTVAPGFTDSGDVTTVTLRVRTALAGSIDDAEARITRFVRKVPASGRSVIVQQGALALTLIKPEQYRDEIQRRIAEAAKHVVGFYGPDYGVTVHGLDREIAWQQVSNTDLFLYIPYSFTISRTN